MLLLTLLVLAATVYLLVRRVEVRLVLLGAGLVLCLLAGRPLLLTDTFARAMVAGMVAPICAAMGFALVIQHTGCDRHLVHLLLMPLRRAGRARFLTLPFGILAAYLMNVAVSSQTSTAAALGPILVPLLVTSGYPPVVAGAALILGASFGGDLLNPGAQDVQAVAGVAGLPAPEMTRRIVPAGIAGALTAALVFTFLHGRQKGGAAADGVSGPVVASGEAFRVHPVRALVPLVPVCLLLLGYGGVPWMRWLVEVPDGGEWRPLANALPVVRAMLLGSLLAALTSWRDLPRLTASLFEGMGAAYGGIISLTITAQCFGAGIAAVGLGDALLGAARQTGALPLLAAGFPWTLALLSGSGSGPVLTFAQTFLAQGDAGGDGAREGVTLAVLACFGGAFGRTTSPVAAVVVYTAGLVNVSPVLLVRTLLPALLAGATVALLLALR